MTRDLNAEVTDRCSNLTDLMYRAGRGDARNEFSNTLWKMRNGSMKNDAIIYPESMLLCFDSYDNRIAKGRLQTLCYRNPFQFESLDQLFLIIDDVLDSINFPRREGKLRHMAGQSGEQPYNFQKLNLKESVKNENEWTDSYCFHGQMAVMVNRREHSSMQGTVVMNGERINFRSVLELMHLFHEYLERNFGK